MNPDIQLFQQRIVQECFQRILFIWSMRHPASGYVQGINDLVTPFFIVFLSYYICEWAGCVDGGLSCMHVYMYIHTCMLVHPPPQHTLCSWRQEPRDLRSLEASG